jgi:hypothetical protein
VEGLVSGMYLLSRHPALLGELRLATPRDFEWQRPAGCPPGLDLFLLRQGDFREVAAGVYHAPNPANHGAFDAVMITEYVDALLAFGAPVYRSLLWEAGMLAEVLNLESEQEGLWASGGDRYYDDRVLEALDVDDGRWQGLYHSTIASSPPSTL